MSNLSEEIERQLGKTHQSIDSIAAKSGLTRSLLYLWKSGDQTTINEAQLQALAPALSDSSADHAAIVRAHLLDETFGPGSELVSITIKGAEELRDAPKPRSRAEQALHYLQQERLINRDLNDLLIDLARVLGWQEHPATPAKSRGKTKYPAHKSRVTRGSEEGLTDKALEILKEGHAAGRGAHPKQSK